MPKRRAACEPCRLSKLACDHRQPACSRCEEHEKSTECVYRERPFKKRKSHATTRPHTQATISSRHDCVNADETTRQHHPNPGYLGASSQATIYSQLEAGSVVGLNHSDAVTGRRAQGFSNVDYSKVDIAQGARLLQDMVHGADIVTYKRLVDAWKARGVNLALAGSFTEVCGSATVNIFQSSSTDYMEPAQRSASLFANSALPLPEESGTTFGEYVAALSGENIRWETIGLFFAAVTKATIEVTYFEPLYGTRTERIRLQQFAVRVVKSCLESSLSLDCMSDLQLMLQYETFIINSCVYGDQSYHSWRQLGDVIGSLWSLGFHEFTEESYLTMPQFLRDLRKVAFARAFSADKNVSIFLGRPPRMSRHHCQLVSPRKTKDDDDPITILIWPGLFEWPAAGGFSYAVESRWSAICAVSKEKALDIQKLKDNSERIELARHIETEAHLQWDSVPKHFRLQEPLNTYDRTPIERGFLASARLNHLHIFFLIHLALVRHANETDSRLANIATEMLGLIVESLLLKTQIANSGTGLVWMVAHYGIPAAGVVCLHLLQLHSMANTDASQSQVLRDLTVLVAEVQSGDLVHPEDPDYPLLNGATRTIARILDRVLTGGAATSTHDTEGSTTAVNDLMWAFLIQDQDYHDFELDFWLGLEDGPRDT